MPKPNPAPEPNQVSTVVPESIGLPRHLFSTERHAAYDDVHMLPLQP
jgi:hypothetical protein